MVFGPKDDVIEGFWAVLSHRLNMKSGRDTAGRTLRSSPKRITPPASVESQA